MRAFIIVHSNDAERIEALVDDGYEAIECSIGGRSIVGKLKMDHHGDNSNLEGVAIRSYRDHRDYYKNSNDAPRFVVTGKADADATFSIASLMGFIPEGNIDLAMLINEMDTAPIGVRLEEKGENGSRILLFNQLGSGIEDGTSFYAGIDIWRWMFSPYTKSRVAIMMKAALEGEKERVRIARLAEYTRINDDVALVESDAWGFDVWYADIAPIIVAYVPGGNITIGAPSIEVAEDKFGPGGLKNIFPHLKPDGWGGRESIGGSPRGHKMTREDASEAAKYIATQVGVRV